MFGLGILKTAIAKLAANLTGLADTVGEINQHLRQRAALDGPEPVEPLTLTAPTPAEASRIAQETTEPTDGHEVTHARNGRRKSVATA